ncbi:uncharacterized protein [Pseudorasbora parva]|uniref:uncharacterized protein n=1 Tax=Pseudorasbora parva TaxID=51549 RepID=UPI00351EBAB8
MADNRIALPSNDLQSYQADNSSLGFSTSSWSPREFCSLSPAFENREIRISHHEKYFLTPLEDQLRFCDKQQGLKNIEKCTLDFTPQPDPLYTRSNFLRDCLQLNRELLTYATAADGGKRKCRFYGSTDDDGGEGFSGSADDDGGEGFHGSNPESDDYCNGSGAAADDGKDKCLFPSSEEDPRLILTRCIKAWDKRKQKPFWLGFLMLFVYLLHRISDQNRGLIFGLGSLCSFCDNHVIMLYNSHEIITVTVMAVVILTLGVFSLFAGSITSFFVSLLILLIICICIDINTWPNNRY